MIRIPLTRGYVAFVSDLDYSRVMTAGPWHVYVQPKTGFVYAVRNTHNTDGRRISQGMHRFILGLTDPKVEVDHRDHNGLNNTRRNIRIATRRQNRCNQRKGAHFSSRCKGVSWHKTNNKWHAQTHVNGKDKHLGYFTSESEACRAYDRAALRECGSFARLNFGKEIL